MSRPFTQLCRWGPLFGHMGVIFYFSSLPRPGLAEFAPDYVLHFAGYAVLGLLAVRAFAGRLLAPAAGRVYLYAVAFSLAYALTDEWHQSFVPGRFPSLEDAAADGLGAAAAASALAFYHRALARSRSFR